MLGTLVAPIYLVLDTILTMNAFDPILWMGCAWALIRMLRGGDLRWWLVFGVFAGLGLENKESILFFGFATVVGLLLTPQRQLMFNRWFLVGGAVALLIALPTLVWQAVHQFPMFEELNNVKHSSKNAPVTIVSYFAAQIAFLLPSFPLAICGLIFFLASDRSRPTRSMGWAYLVMWGVFVTLKGKTYYIAPIYPAIIAGGAVWLEAIETKLWRPLIRRGLPALILTVGAASAPLALPVVPVEKLIAYQRALGLEIPRTETSRLAELAQIFADMFGWENMTATIAQVYKALPPEDRADAAILANNYGEAEQSISSVRATDCRSRSADICATTFGVRASTTAALWSRSGGTKRASSGSSAVLSGRPRSITAMRCPLRTICRSSYAGFREFRSRCSGGRPRSIANYTKLIASSPAEMVGEESKKAGALLKSVALIVKRPFS